MGASEATVNAIGNRFCALAANGTRGTFLFDFQLCERHFLSLTGWVFSHLFFPVSFILRLHMCGTVTSPLGSQRL